MYATDGQLLPYSSFTATFPAARITEQKYSQLGRVPALYPGQVHSYYNMEHLFRKLRPGTITK